MLVKLIPVQYSAISVHHVTFVWNMFSPVLVGSLTHAHDNKHSVVAEEIPNSRRMSKCLIRVQFINGWLGVGWFTQLVLGGLLHQQREFPHEVTTELVLLQRSRHHG